LSGVGQENLQAYLRAFLEQFNFDIDCVQRALSDNFQKKTNQNQAPATTRRSAQTGQWSVVTNH
jgi:hypothetical protein